MQIIALPPHIQDKLQTIAQQAHRGADLIQQILDFSRQSIMERKPVNLLPFMEKLVKLLKRTLPENVHITLDCSEEKYILLADASRLQQVIMNLAVNARDAMPQGGQIVIRLTRVQTMRAKPILVRELPPGSWIQIQVSDSGGGIPPHVLPQIFEPFFTTKEVGKGTGLGLAQAYGIMQQHEGHIDVITAMGQGTTFMLYLPSPDGTNRDVQAPRRAKLQEGKGQTVLIVEDNPTTLGALVDSLLLLNYKVIEVGNGREALNVLTDPARPIDLVLSDVVMPEMGGIALLQAMQAQQMTVPIVLLTGHPLSSEMEDLESMGLAGWLLKPPTLAKLSQLLAQVLD
jgi:CheY-like chemotaxis protein